MSFILRQILILFALFITGQTWGASVAHHQYDVGSFYHDANEYDYDAAVNYKFCCGRNIGYPNIGTNPKYHPFLFSTKSGTQNPAQLKNINRFQKKIPANAKKYPNTPTAK